MDGWNPNSQNANGFRGESALWAIEALDYPCVETCCRLAGRSAYKTSIFWYDYYIFWAEIYFAFAWIRFFFWKKYMSFNSYRFVKSTYGSMFVKQG